MTRVGRRSGRRTEGIALVESAIILPFLFLLAFGVFEAGFAWRDANVLNRATQNAARVDARVAEGRTADYEALRSLQSGLSAISASSVERIIIYDAATTADRPPQACLDLTRPDDLSIVGVNGLCNVYSPTQLRTDLLSAFDNANCSGDWDQRWCPTTDRERDGANADRVGVWVELGYDGITRVLPGDQKLTHGAVFQLEPCIAGDPSC